MSSELTAVVIIVDDDWSRLLLGYAVRSVSFEFGTDFLRSDIIKVDNYDRFTFFGFDFL